MTDEGEMIADRYRLLTRVGSGAMGVVWQAYDERLHRVVAVKQLLLHSGASPDKAEEANRRAMREGRITARLHHPHAITVYDVAEHQGKPCLIMEYLRSESLSTVLDTRGALPPEQVARIGRQITSALSAAHEAGIVHRDIKPGNVLLADDGTAKITDFGISRAIGDGTVTVTGVLAGTPAFFAPEVAKGQDADFPADVFSLGATLYAAVEGQPPFGLDDNAIALLFRITTSEVPEPQQAGPLAPLLTWTLDRDPARRPTMRQLHDALTAVTEQRQPTVETRRTPVVPPPRVEPTRSSAAAPGGPQVPAAGRAAAAPGARVPGSSAPAGDSAQRQRTVRTVAVAALATVLIGVGILAFVLADPWSGDADRAAAPASTSAPPPSRQAPPPPLPPPPAPTTEAPPTTTTSPPTTEAVAPPATPDQQGAAVAEYYSLVPGDLEAGWARLTSSYQSNHAGGFAAYQNFWGAIEQVRVSAISVPQPGTVQATLDYFYKGGRAVRERTSFGLVAEDGIWKIGSSRVISSRGN
ncbi:MAG TPA: serine/threonine-protein kinase [Pseudonocardiaceae bacterium]|nr:serine/threonine-protein kinase [Pseudonocardiaceae bacterium]